MVVSKKIYFSMFYLILTEYQTRPILPHDSLILTDVLS